MAYNNFSLSKVKSDFNLTLDETQNLFMDVEGVTPTDFLQQALREYVPLATAINTEKARSELIIAQVLTEVRRQTNHQISLFSGTEFNVDEGKGLVGFCDFIITNSTEQMFISAPVISITEAKNESIKGGLGQCIAAMLAAQIFNEQAGNQIERIYGAVTSGTVWKFMTLQEKTVYIDSAEYYISQVDKILGILLQAVQ
jgi:hypothetical protein